MSLQGSVLCNCFRDGKVKEPPIDRSLIYFDEAYAFVHYPESFTKEAEYELETAMGQWQKSACEHENMHYCYVECYHRNAIQLMLIAEELEFPVLGSLYPYGNGGQIQVETAKKALNELDQFREKLPTVVGAYLVNVNTGQDRCSFFRGEPKFFAGYWLEGVCNRIAFDEKGLLVSNLETNQEVFRSTVFTQQRIASVIEPSPYPHGSLKEKELMLLTDHQTGEQCKIITCSYLGDKNESFKVIKRQYKEEDLFCMEPLRQLLNASIETGNPINWH